jgi:hypothetical protein
MLQVRVLPRQHSAPDRALGRRVAPSAAAADRRVCAVPSPRTATATLALAGLALVGAACGSSSTPSTASGTTASTSATASTGAPSPSSATPAGSTANQFAAGPVPAVDGATNLKAAPTVHAGTVAAPTALTGADLVVGAGQVASSSNTVNVQYVGTLYTDGTSFDSSWAHGQSASFALSGVIPGFAQGIVGMKVGGRRELVIPSNLGYGASANGTIPANSTLVFVVDLLGVS